MYQISSTRRYRTAIKKLARQKDRSLNDIERVVTLLSMGDILPERYRDHELKGVLRGIRECHVKNDLLLLYRKEKDILVLLLVDIGTHAHLFEQ